MQLAVDMRGIRRGFGEGGLDADAGEDRGGGSGNHGFASGEHLRFPDNCPYREWKAQAVALPSQARRIV